jgi:hypothetical protein
MVKLSYEFTYKFHDFIISAVKTCNYLVIRFESIQNISFAIKRVNKDTDFTINFLFFDSIG